jgi:prepilin-type N-terminal cleavage/methylation domain-containing protein
MNRRPPQHRSAFTLSELVIVMVIIGLLAAIAIPRLSRGSEGSGVATLVADLRAVRQAIYLYTLEHMNELPGPTADHLVTQLTQFTNRTGGVSATKTAAYVFGPYLHQMPPCPLGPNAGSSDVLIDSANSPPLTNTSGGEGWVYNPNTGEFIANIPDEQLTEIQVPLGDTLIGADELLRGGRVK